MSTVKTVIPEDGYKVLEGFYRILKHETDKTFAKKIISYILKITVKVMIAIRNNQLNKEEMDLVADLGKQETSLLKTIISFIEVNFTYDANYLTDRIEDLHQTLFGVLQRHCKPKTRSKIEFIFTELSDKQRLGNIFGNTATEEIEKQKIEIVIHIRKLI